MCRVFLFSLLQRSAIYLLPLGIFASCGGWLLIRQRQLGYVRSSDWFVLMAVLLILTVLAVAFFGERARRVHSRILQANDGLRQANAFLLRESKAYTQLEKTLHCSEERGRELVGLSSDWYWEMDEHFRYAISPSEIQKEAPPPRFLPIDFDASDWASHRTVLEAHQPFRNFEFKTLYKTLIDGVPVEWISASGKPIFDHDGRFKGYWGIGRNISAHKRGEEALRQSSSEISRLRAHLELVKEDERKRIAREIHDDLGQNLIVLRLDISMLSEHINDAFTLQRINSALQQIDTTIKAVRAIITDLRPAVLDLGFHAAIEWQIKEFERSTGIACELQIDHEEFLLDDKRVTGLFRIVQESLTNIIRHAQASHVRIGLQRRNDALFLQIADDGIGYAPDSHRKEKQFGLVGIKERINAFGGTFCIASKPGKGTALMLSIPIADMSHWNAPGPESSQTVSPKN